jgi:hypothetical protein
MSEVLACPECDATQIYNRRSDDVGRFASKDVARYGCSYCGARFDDPVRRESHIIDINRKGLAGELADADPDEVGGKP